MTKKIICLILALVMLAGIALTSCSQSEEEKQSDIAEKASESAMTLSMYIMTENKLSEQTKKDISAAVTAITEERLSTKLILRFYTEAEYYEALDKAFADRKKAEAAGTVNKVEEIVNDDPTIDKESGEIKINYPAIADYQVDIFYLGGRANYDKYNELGLLSDLGGEIDASIRTSVHGQYIKAMEALNNKKTYAIPTNGVIGEYTYLMLNKKAMNEAYRRNESGENDYSAYTSITCDGVQDLLTFVSDSTEMFGDYDKIYTNLSDKELLINNFKTWSFNERGEVSDGFSVLGGFYPDSYDFLTEGEYVPVENLFENERFVNDLTVLKNYDANGYVVSEDEKTYDGTFAVGYVKGGAELVEKYGDEYEMIVLESPKLDAQTLYNDMFAVSTQTSALDRSMDVISLLYTDETLRNLLLYGIEDDHYQLVDTEVTNKYGEKILAVQRFNENYILTPEKTGNVFNAYPLVGESLSLREFQTKQNREAKIDMTLGFNVGTANADHVASVKALSDEIFADYEALEVDPSKDGADIAEFIEAARVKVSESEAVAYLLNAENTDSLVAVYNAWLKTNKVIK